MAKVMPAALLESRFRQQPGGERTLNLLARPHHEVHPEHAVVSARHLVTVVSNLIPDWVRIKVRDIYVGVRHLLNIVKCCC